MPTIGSFTRQADGSYSGSIKTLTLNVKAAQVRANDKTGSGLPHLLRPDRVRRGMGSDLPREPRIPVGHARRPQLPGSDLRLAGRGRGRARPDLVPLRGLRRRRPSAAASSRTWRFVGVRRRQEGYRRRTGRPSDIV